VSVPEEAVTAAKAHVFHAITRWKMAASDDAVVQVMARNELIRDVVEFAAPLIADAAVAAERERIAAELNSRADGLDGMVPAEAGASAADLKLMATTLRNTAWAIVSGDQAENLREATDG
jgi:hypothetical protein